MLKKSFKDDKGRVYVIGALSAIGEFATKTVKMDDKHDKEMTEAILQMISQLLMTEEQRVTIHKMFNFMDLSGDGALDE